MKNFVEPTADYFFENQLVSNETQSIQLTSTKMSDGNEGVIYLKMIDKDNSLNQAEQKQIALLEKDLGSTVFENTNFEIVICNDNFIAIE